MRMHNPPHPGEVLRDYLGGVSITDAAKHLGGDAGSPVPHS